MVRLTRSWELVKACARVLDADRELLVFPLLSGVAGILVLVGFAAPAWALSSLVLPEAASVPLLVVGTVLLAFVQTAVVLYFQSALVGAALLRMEGRDPTLSDGLAAANARLGIILAWSAVAAVVSAILQALSKRQDGSTRPLPMLAGMAWNVATFLVVPVLVAEGLGPWAALQRSIALFKQTWGEQVAGTAGLGTAFGLATVLWVGGLGLFAAGLMQLGLVAGVVVLAVIGVLGLVALGTAHTAMLGVYRAAVYRYATHGDVLLFEARELQIPR